MPLIFGRANPETFRVRGIRHLPHLLGTISGLIVFFEHPTGHVDVFFAVDEEDWEVIPF